MLKVAGKRDGIVYSKPKKSWEGAGTTSRRPFNGRRFDGIYSWKTVISLQGELVTRRRKTSKKCGGQNSQKEFDTWPSQSRFPPSYWLLLPYSASRVLTDSSFCGVIKFSNITPQNEFSFVLAFLQTLCILNELSLYGCRSSASVLVEHWAVARRWKDWGIETVRRGVDFCVEQVLVSFSSFFWSRLPTLSYNMCSAFVIWKQNRTSALADLVADLPQSQADSCSCGAGPESPVDLYIVTSYIPHGLFLMPQVHIYF